MIQFLGGLGGGSLSPPRLNIFTVGNMRVMICLGQGGLHSLSASSLSICSIFQVRILLLSHIAQLRVDNRALKSDMKFVAETASFLLRSILSIALCRGWAHLTEKSLEYCIRVKRRLQPSHLPMRQIMRGKSIPEADIKRIEASGIKEDVDNLKDEDVGLV